MNLSELAEQLKCTEEYLAYLKSILDGTEAYYTDEDEQEALELEECLLEIDEAE